MLGLPKTGFEALIDERPVEEIFREIEENENKVQKIKDSVIFPL
jgi:hypothetical protein